MGVLYPPQFVNNQRLNPHVILIDTLIIFFVICYISYIQYVYRLLNAKLIYVHFRRSLNLAQKTKDQ